MSKKSTGKTVRVSLDPANPPKTGENTKSRLAAMRDEDIDFSDIPPSPNDAAWVRAGVPVTSENKRQVTLRLDADVLDYFREQGSRYQTRINQVLRTYMQAHLGE